MSEHTVWLGLAPLNGSIASFIAAASTAASQRG
jgi:hypothetical protein